MSGCCLRCIAITTKLAYKHFADSKLHVIFLLLIVVCCESSALRLIGYQEVALSPASEFVRAPPSQLSAKVLVQLESLDILTVYFYKVPETHL